MINFALQNSYPLLLTPHQILKKYWGYDEFRPLQEEIIQSVIAGRDTLGLLPTGGGKSITFQVPALYLGGLAVVVTPLISLMKDQVDNLRRHGIKGVFFHAGMSAYEQRTSWERLLNGKCNFLYVSPERLANPLFLDELKHLPVTLLVVDESHCISQWGYDFRPSYLNIGKVRKVFPKVPVLALTATATPVVEEDICRQLLMTDPAVWRKSFSRENLNYIVRAAESKIDQLVHIVRHTTGSGIVYVRSRKKARELAENLALQGIECTYYHAGLTFQDKEERQNKWKSDQIRIMVATNAFGMGIDKPDVRLVVHYDFPSSLEEYYQEAGRAGRDGRTSYAVLLVNARDRATLSRRLSDAFPPKEVVLKVYERVANYLHLAIGEGYAKLFEFDIDDFCATFSMQEQQVRAALKILSASGYMDFVDEMDTRSRVIIIYDREQLYYVDGLSADAEKILGLLLRIYPGLFADYVFINENRLVVEAGIPYPRVYDALKELDKMKVVNYIPAKRVPYIYMPTSREEPRYVEISREAYEWRRDRMAKRIQAMMDYGFNDSSCRVGRMLAYFGETDAGDCGLCDVCRKRKADSRSVADIRAAERSLMEQVEEFSDLYPHDISAEMLRQRFGERAREAMKLLNKLREKGLRNDRPC